MRTSLWLVAFAMVFTLGEVPSHTAGRIIVILVVALFAWCFGFAVWGDVRELRDGRS